MPRRAPEPCLFCGKAPCECYGKKPKKRAAAQSKPPPVTPNSDIDFGSIEAQPRFKAGDPRPERDLPFMNALRSLMDIVSDRDKRWIDTQLNPPLPQELDKRVSDWRAKHGKSAQAPHTSSAEGDDG